LNFDSRITPARPDLAAAYLKGRVDAARFVDGVAMDIVVGRASLRAAPSDDALQDSELLFGERVSVYDRANGWAWVQAGDDNYVGYVRQETLGQAGRPSLRVVALMAPAFAKPDLKTPVRDLLPLNARVAALAQDGDYVEIMPGRFVHRRHVAPLDQLESDFVAVAERFVGVPYVWGGKTFAGMDCSGLIQTALKATGFQAPRDTDMMERDLGRPIALVDVRRADLIFWKGHMGVALDSARLLHANAFHMQVTIDPLAEALARNEALAGPVTAVKRLDPRQK